MSTILDRLKALGVVCRTFITEASFLGTAVDKVPSSQLNKLMLYMLKPHYQQVIFLLS